METENTGLEGAVLAIQKEARAAALVGVETFNFGDIEIPVVVMQNNDGAPAIQGLNNEIRGAYNLAKELRLEKADGPDRREGTAHLQSIESFIAHANRFKAPNSAVWADGIGRRLVSVLDYHPEKEAAPKWGRHRGIYPCPLSEGWLAWGGVGGKRLDQDDFAELLDTRDFELVGGKLPSGATAPEPSYLVTLASNLEVFSNASARRERDPNTGRLRIAFSEEKGVSGDVLPPKAFLVNVPIFEDSFPSPIEVRLRVTVEDGKAWFHLQIHAAKDVLRAAFEGLCNVVEEETELPVFIGVPE